MPAVDNQQITQLLDAYADNNFCFENSQGNVLHAEEADEQRRERLPLLQDHLDDFVRGETELKEFKSEIDSQNKQYPFWGFKGMNGMMFF